MTTGHPGQPRWTRTYRPGPWRVGLLVAQLLGGAWTVLAALLLVAGARGGVALALAVGASLGVLGCLAWVGVRCYRVGLWVRDAGVREVTLRRTRSWSWSEVDRVDVAPARVRLLGTPLRCSGREVRLVVDGQSRATVLQERSPDFLARPEAFEAAADAVRTWHREAGTAGSARPPVPRQGR